MLTLRRDKPLDGPGLDWAEMDNNWEYVKPLFGIEPPTDDLGFFGKTYIQIVNDEITVYYKTNNGWVIKETNISNSGSLIPVDEGNGIGYVIAEEDRSDKASIGYMAKDFSNTVVFNEFS